MKMPDCFEAYRILPLIAAGLLVAGCDSGDISSGSGGFRGCASNLPEPTDFEEKFDTFTISDDSQQNPVGADIGKTLFRKFFKASEPDSGESEHAKDIYAFMSEETDAIAHFDDIDNLPDYNSVRNDFDLIEAMITESNQFESLQRARDAMASCARDTQQAIDEGKEGEPGSARIDTATVTEESDDDESGDKESDPESWSYFINYAHNPEPLDDTTPFGANIARLIIGETAVIFSLYEIDQFTGDSAASGFKQPGKLSVGFNATPEETIGDTNTDEGSEENTGDTKDNEPSIFFDSFPLDDTKDDFREERGETDRWEWSSEEAHDIDTPEDGTIAAKCVRLDVDYSDNNQVSVEIGEDTCPGIDKSSGSEPDEATFSYTSANPDVSQTR